MIGFARVDAHSASDAYLTLSVEHGGLAEHGGSVERGGSVENGGAQRKTIVHGQWDIALRDLDFVSKLDDDGDGRLTWGEVRRHQAAIEQYAYAHLHFAAGGRNPCEVTPTRQLIDDHADGAYAALFFDVACPGEPRNIRLVYDLFFAIDPSHRGIFVMHDGSNTATAVLSPQNATLDLGIEKLAELEPAAVRKSGDWGDVAAKAVTARQHGVVP